MSHCQERARTSPLVALDVANLPLIEGTPYHARSESALYHRGPRPLRPTLQRNFGGFPGELTSAVSDKQRASRGKCPRRTPLDVAEAGVSGSPLGAPKPQCLQVFRPRASAVDGAPWGTVEGESGMPPTAVLA